MRPSNSVRADTLKYHQWFRVYSSDGTKLLPQLFRQTGSDCFNIICEHIKGDAFKPFAISHDWPVLPINVQFTLKAEEIV